MQPTQQEKYLKAKLVFDIQIIPIYSDREPLADIT